MFFVFLILQLQTKTYKDAEKFTFSISRISIRRMTDKEGNECLVEITLRDVCPFFLQDVCVGGLDYI
jgi:hypothetical protein